MCIPTMYLWWLRFVLPASFGSWSHHRHQLLNLFSGPWRDLALCSISLKTPSHLSSLQVSAGLWEPLAKQGAKQDMVTASNLSSVCSSEQTFNKTTESSTWMQTHGLLQTLLMVWSCPTSQASPPTEGPIHWHQVHCKVSVTA